MKITCTVCLKAFGKRSCIQKQNAMICPQCCAAIRDHTCQQCSYYIAAKNHTASKRDKAKEHVFIAQMTPEASDQVDEALMLLEKGRKTQATQRLSALAAKYPREHIVHFGLGVLCLKNDDIDGAIAEFEKSVELFPYFADGYYNLAMAYQKKADFVKALKNFQKVVEYGEDDHQIVPPAIEFIKTFENYARTNHEIGVETYIRAVELFDQGFIQMKQSRWNEAIASFKKSILLCEKTEQVHGNLGLCYAKTGQKALSLKELDRALEINPDYEPAILNRAYILEADESKMSSTDFKEISYNLDYTLKGKSYIREAFEKIKKIWE